MLSLYKVVIELLAKNPRVNRIPAISVAIEFDCLYSFEPISTEDIINEMIDTKNRIIIQLIALELSLANKSYTAKTSIKLIK